MVVFALATVLRAIPEFLAGRYPVGFDVTSAYPYAIIEFGSQPIAWVVGQTPLFYALMWTVYSVSGLDVYTLLKTTGPLLYGALSVSFLIFLYSFLKFSALKSTVGAILFILQPITLRISWDLFHNEFGLVLMFLTLGALGSGMNKKGLIIGSLAILTVLAHPLAGILLFAILIGRLTVKGISKVNLRELLVFAPAILVFTVTVWALMLPPVPINRIISIAPNPSATAPSPLQNVYRDDFRFIGASYWQIFGYVGMLFVASFGPLLPLVAKGYFREPAITVMTAVLGLGAFSVLVSPSASIPFYYRWEMMLIIPFAIFATNGLDKIGALLIQRRRYLIGILLSFSLIAVGYSSGLFSFMGAYGVNSFAPATMVQSSIPSSHIDDAIASLRWLNANSRPNSYILMDERYLSFSYVNLGSNFDLAVQPGGPPFQGAVETILIQHPAALYLIWDGRISIKGFSPLHNGQYTTIYQFSDQSE